MTVGAFHVRTIQLNHPGINLGYRFECAGGTFVILTDLAPIRGNHLGLGWAERASSNPSQFELDYQAGLVEFIRGADLVYHDTNFTDSEIEGHYHWGHSTPTYALELLAQVSASPVLVLSHHDPEHSDDFLDGFYEDARQRGKGMGVEVRIAREGGSFSL